MTQLINAFDPTQYDPSQGGGSMPVGTHPVVIQGAEVKPNTAGDGGYLELLLRIIEGPAAGTTGPYRLNLYHAKPNVVEIANRQLSAVCHVVNVFRLGQSGQDVSALFNIPFCVEVGLQKGEEAAAKGYTEIRKVFDINGNEPKRAGSGPQNAQPQGQQGGGHGQGGNATGMQGHGVPQGNNGGQAGGWQGGNGGGGQAGGNAAWGGSNQQQQVPQNNGNTNGGGAAWGGGQPQQNTQGNNGGQAGGWQGGNGGGQQNSAPAWGNR